MRIRLRRFFAHGIFVYTFYGCKEADSYAELVESVCDNKEIIEANIRSVKISSPDVRRAWRLS